MAKEQEQGLTVGLWNHVKDDTNPVGDYFETGEGEEVGDEEEGLDHIQFSVKPPKETGYDLIEIRLHKDELERLAKKYLP